MPHRQQRTQSSSDEAADRTGGRTGEEVMAFNFFNTVCSAVLTPLTSAFDISAQLVGVVGPFISIGITLILIAKGYATMRGSMGGQPMLEVFNEIAKPVLVLNVALIGGAYTNNIVGSFADLRTSLSGLFGAQGINSYAALDDGVSSVLSAIFKALPGIFEGISFIPANFTGVLEIVLLAAIGFFYLFYCIVAAINLMLIDASLSIVIGVGPLFVACMAFQATAKFFDSWLSSILKYTLTAVFVSAVIGVTNGIIKKLADDFAKNPDAGDYITLSLGFIATSLLLISLIVKSASIAADLVGGIALNIAGPREVANSMRQLAAPVANAASYAVGAATGGIARGAAAAGSMAAGSSLGARVLKATESMRSSAGATTSAAATGLRNFGSAVGGRQGVGSAFDIGRNAASRSTGHGTVTSGGRPIPHVKD